jgi:hypothetical protein
MVPTQPRLSVQLLAVVVRPYTSSFTFMHGFVYCLHRYMRTELVELCKALPVRRLCTVLCTGGNHQPLSHW